MYYQHVRSSYGRHGHSSTRWHTHCLPGRHPTMINTGVQRPPRSRSFVFGILLCGILSVGWAAASLIHRRHSFSPTTEADTEDTSPSQAPYHARRDWAEGPQSGPGPRSGPQASQTAPAPSDVPGTVLPVIGGPDAKADTEQMMAILTRSGPSTGDLDSRAMTVFETWKNKSAVGGKVEFSDFKCFAGGCSVVATYAGMDGYVDMRRDFQRSREFLTWPGPKFRSGPIQDSSGRVQATWVLQK
jgi:hypothetical protein